LGTEDKREQLAKIENLLQGANDPTVAITVLFSKGRVTLGLTGEPNVSGDNIKYILSMAIDEVTEQMVRARMAQEEIPEEIGPQTGDTMANGDMTP
jgi:hypothetical protein